MLVQLGGEDCRGSTPENIRDPVDIAWRLQFRIKGEKALTNHFAGQVTGPLLQTAIPVKDGKIFGKDENT